MAKTREQKKREIKDLEDRIGRAKSLVFTSYAGLDVPALEELRSKLREQGVEYQAARKRLIDLALDNNKLEHDSVKGLAGSIGVAFGINDEVSPARIAKKFAEKNEKFGIRAGLLKIGESWRYLSAVEVMNLASLPTREELLAKAVGSIKAPLSGLVNVLAGNLRGLVNVLGAIKNTK
jgi:large subunit ribosomal protein L10